MNTSEFLKSKQINTVYSINPFIISEKRETELKPEHQVRAMTEKEIIIELDIKDGFDTPELRQKLYEIQLENFNNISEKGFEVYLFNHKGKCPHIRLYNFEGLNKQNQLSFFQNFVMKYCKVNPEHTTYDKSFYASFHWCPIEFQKHYKYGTIYELEKFENIGNKNIVEKELVKEIQNNSVRKVTIDYLKILEKPDATEQERSSCVMQIVNKMKLNKEETLGLIIKHNKWSDFDPIITSNKLDYIWKYTEKPNPIQVQSISENIDKAIFSFSNYYDMADQFLKIQPLYYNGKKFWWAWDQQEYCWKLIDETDILNALNKTIHGLKLFESKQKNEIITALQMRARLRKPKDAPDTWIQFKNKIFDYKTGEIIEASPEYFITNPIPFEIGETEETPTLDKWFKEWVGEKWTPTLYEIIAFCCVPHYRLNRIFCLNGEGRNGKSTFLHIIRNFIGEKNTCSSSMDTILSRPFETAKLYKKLLCEMGEINSGIFRKTELIKKLVGSDKIGFEFKGKDGFDDYNYAKIVVATNKLPETTDKTTGFYSKWIIIDFPNRFKENPNFLEGLSPEEYPALAKKCCRIIQELMNKGQFINEGSAEEKQLRYEEKSSPFNDFMKLEMDKDENQETPFFMIFKEYSSYCGQRNLRIPSKVEVGRILRAKGFVPTTTRFILSNGTETTVQAYKGLFFKEEKVIVDPDSKDVGLNSFESV